MQDLLFTVLHLYALTFFIRALMGTSPQTYFHPAMRFIQDITDPVLLFPRRNNLLRHSLNPWIIIVLLLLLKTVFLQSLQTGVSLSGFRTLLLSTMIGFLSFLFKFYLVSFIIAWSAARLGMHGEIFTVFRGIVNRTLQYLPVPGQVPTVQNQPGKALGMIMALFFALFLVFHLQFGFREALIFTLNPGSGGTAPGMGESLIEVIGWFFPLILIRIVISFFDLNVNTALQLLFALTEPVLHPFRKLGLVIGIFDFSPILAWLTIGVVQTLLNFVLLLLIRLIHGGMS